MGIRHFISRNYISFILSLTLTPTITYPENRPTNQLGFVTQLTRHTVCRLTRLARPSSAALARLQFESSLVLERNMLVLFRRLSQILAGVLCGRDFVNEIVSHDIYTPKT